MLICKPCEADSQLPTDWYETCRHRGFMTSHKFCCVRQRIVHPRQMRRKCASRRLYDRPSHAVYHGGLPYRTKGALDVQERVIDETQLQPVRQTNPFEEVGRLRRQL